MLRNMHVSTDLQRCTAWIIVSRGRRSILLAARIDEEEIHA